MNTTPYGTLLADTLDALPDETRAEFARSVGPWSHLRGLSGGHPYCRVMYWACEGWQLRSARWRFNFPENQEATDGATQQD